ncbi:MAG: sulfatase-like hydrolase/transferase [Elusimicrobiaceae bacterium]|nr:sulfatase-like hydrolase/transferase [Elusimicrobiaceae bacterium]
MKDFLKKHLLPLKQDIPLFTVLALPGLIMFLIGLNQFDAIGGLSLTLGLAIKLICEFLTLAVIFYFFHFLGIKRIWALALVIFFYYITLCSDLAILIYFKERFVSKYLMTLGGANYKFMRDVRLLTIFLILYSLAYFAIKKLWVKTSFKQSTKKLAVAAVLLLLISCISPLKYIATEQAFYNNLLMDTPVINLTKDIISNKPNHQISQKLPTELEDIAKEYNLFTPTNFKNKNTYKKIILLTTEALSNKFISSFNPNIPPEASSIYDGLLYYYPYASLKPVTLSTLYGLSVIFSGHPNAELSFKNGYPLSFVKLLKNDGFKTVFIRGANEEYMNEHITFKKAGFDEIYGAATFERNPKYATSVAWWGLTDRKLFDFVVEYLKQHKNDEKIFIDILNVDTHVPTGRTDYLGQEYSEITDINPKIEALYKKPNMPRAFARHNEDLGRFLKNLQDENLLDEDTILIITADHPFYANLEGGGIYKGTRPMFNEVPIIFISKKPILENISQDLFKSQQDIAPTILGLAGLNIPRGMFGRSIFDNQAHTVFNIKDGYVKVSNTSGSKIVPFGAKDKQNKVLLQLLNTALVEEK